MKEIFNTLIVLSFLICAPSGLIITACKGEKEKESTPITRPVKTLVLGESSLTGRSFPGKVQATQRVDLSFRVSGPLIEFPVFQGQKVEKGQPLARIDPRDYKIAVDEASARHIEAKADFQRYEQLYIRDAVPLADLDVRRAKLKTAKAKLDLALADLNDTYLRAPFRGYVGAKFVENYQEVRAYENILSLQDVSEIEIVINLPENVIATAKKGTIERLYASFQTAPGKEFLVTLKEISAQADPRTQTYSATFTMPQPEGVRILPGMTAQVHVEGLAGAADNPSYFIIPATAVFAGDTGAQYVWVIDSRDMIVHRKEVKVGAVTGADSIEVLGGLKTGDMIAVAGISQLQEGMKVRPIGQEENKT
jgi:multidrug efflux system membrane fusion protein